MNKLVSRNPVLRFKERRKISKGKSGLVTKLLNKIHNGIKSFLKTAADPDFWFNTSGKYLTLQNEYNPLTLIQNGIKQVIGDSPAPSVKVDEVSPTTRLDSPKGKNNPPATSGFIKGYLKTDDIQNVINQYGGIKGFQQFLIDNKFLSGDMSKKEGADGWWGGNTQKAYEAWKTLNTPFTAPDASEIPGLVPESTTVEQPIIPTNPNNALREAITGLTLLEAIMGLTLLEESSVPAIKFNRADTRNLIRNVLGKNAHLNFTGNQRKALRQYMNGELYNAKDLEAFGDLNKFNVVGKNGTVYSNSHVRNLFEKPIDINSNSLFNVPFTNMTYTKYFKNGGNIILPSRNIVKRFKLRNFRIVAQ